MTAIEALRAARAAGVEVALDGNTLVLEASMRPPETVLDALSRNKAGIVTLLRPHDDGWSDGDWQAFFDERAGIAEFDGGLSRVGAEVLAFDCCVVEWLNRNPSRSDPGRCLACGKSDRRGHAVGPFGIQPHGHSWLHPECWPAWYGRRQQQAKNALARMGLRASMEHSRGGL